MLCQARRGWFILVKWKLNSVCFADRSNNGDFTERGFAAVVLCALVSGSGDGPDLYQGVWMPCRVGTGGELVSSRCVRGVCDVLGCFGMFYDSASWFKWPSRQTEIRWPPKDKQTNSTAYGESLFSINKLNHWEWCLRMVFYFHGSYSACAGLGCSKGACEGLCSSPSSHTALCAQPKAFPQPLAAGRRGLQQPDDLPRGPITMDCSACPHLGRQRAPGSPTVSLPAPGGSGATAGAEQLSCEWGACLKSHGASRVGWTAKEKRNYKG